MKLTASEKKLVMAARAEERERAAFKRLSKCTRCGGDGILYGSQSEVACWRCGGSGKEDPKRMSKMAKLEKLQEKVADLADELRVR